MVAMAALAAPRLAATSTLTAVTGVREEKTRRHLAGLAAQRCLEARVAAGCTPRMTRRMPTATGLVVVVGPGKAGRRTVPVGAEQARRASDGLIAQRPPIATRWGLEALVARLACTPGALATRASCS